jgi:hypothetical protein
MTAPAQAGTRLDGGPVQSGQGQPTAPPQPQSPPPGQQGAFFERRVVRRWWAPWTKRAVWQQISAWQMGGPPVGATVVTVPDVAALPGRVHTSAGSDRRQRSSTDEPAPNTRGRDAAVVRAEPMPPGTGSAVATGSLTARWAAKWKPALNAFTITFNGPDHRDRKLTDAEVRSAVYPGWPGSQRRYSTCRLARGDTILT